MAKNTGKQFEADISSSAPSDCFVHRLKDSAQSYNNSKQTKFAWQNPCDFFIWDGNNFYAIECKSTKYKSMSVQLKKEDDSNKMVKYHQIESLKNMAEYKIVAGFFLNFRGEDDDNQRTYFVEINDFLNMLNQTKKMSFNELDLLSIGKAIKIQGVKKRIHWKWDLKSFFESYQYE